MPEWRNGRRAVLKMQFLRKYGFESRVRYVKKIVITEKDKNLSLIFWGVTSLTLSILFLIHFFTNIGWTVVAGLFITGWFYGAGLVWILEKLLR